MAKKGGGKTVWENGRSDSVQLYMCDVKDVFCNMHSIQLAKAVKFNSATTIIITIVKIKILFGL